MMLILRNKLKYALTGSEVTKIVNQRLIKVDGKVRTDATYPTGFMDVVSIEKTGEFFRIHYDVKGRFLLHRISAEEAEVGLTVHFSFLLEGEGEKFALKLRHFRSNTTDQDLHSQTWSDIETLLIRKQNSLPLSFHV